MSKKFLGFSSLDPDDAKFFLDEKGIEPLKIERTTCEESGQERPALMATVEAEVEPCAYGWHFFPEPPDPDDEKEIDESIESYENTTLAEAHRELNQQLGWFTVGHEWVCSACGAPFGPNCDCNYDEEGNELPAEQVPEVQPREVFAINLAQLFGGRVQRDFQFQIVRLYAPLQEGAEWEVRIEQE